MAQGVYYTRNALAYEDACASGANAGLPCAFLGRDGISAFAGLFASTFQLVITLAKPAAALHCSADYLPEQAACDARSQCRSNEIFWKDLEPAAVRAWEGAPAWPSEIPGKDDSHGKGTVPTGGLLRPTGCLGSPCALMDPGHPVYKAHLLKMAQTMIAKAPSSGLCVDRQDMVGGVINDRGDDGRTYFTANASKISAVGGGVAGRSSMFSVLDLLEDMGEVLHSAGKGIMVNTHTSRIDMFRNVDGIFDVQRRGLCITSAHGHPTERPLAVGGYMKLPRSLALPNPSARSMPALTYG